MSTSCCSWSYVVALADDKAPVLKKVGAKRILSLGEIWLGANALLSLCLKVGGKHKVSP